jgi:hypothetical protein
VRQRTANVTALSWTSFHAHKFGHMPQPQDDKSTRSILSIAASSCSF